MAYRKDIFFYIAISLSTIFLSSSLFSCENSKKDLDDMNTKNLGVEVVKNVDINYTLGGKAKAKLLSPLMLRVQEDVPYVEFPNKLHVDFFNDTAGVDSRLDSHYGKYYETQSRVFLRDSVKVINISGDTLYCNELWWDRSKTGNEFYTDKPVRIRTRTEIIDGIGMEASQDFKQYHIVQVVGIIKVASSQFPGN